MWGTHNVVQVQKTVPGGDNGLVGALPGSVFSGEMLCPVCVQPVPWDATDFGLDSIGLQECFFVEGLFEVVRSGPFHVLPVFGKLEDLDVRKDVRNLSSCVLSIRNLIDELQERYISWLLREMWSLPCGV